TAFSDWTPAPLCPCSADDLAEVVAALDHAGADWPLGIERLVAHEDPAALPGLWPRLFELLAAAGVDVVRAQPREGSLPEVVVVQCPTCGPRQVSHPDT